MSTNYAYPNGPLLWHAAPHDFTGDNNLGIYTVETTQRYVYGTRYITWDGRVYKYSLSGGEVYTHMLNSFMNSIDSDYNGIDYSVLTNAQSAGDREITLTNGSTAVAEDYLAGGIVIIVPTETTTNREVMTRMIIGNESAAASAECRMFLEFPLETAVTTSNYAYAMPSSYSLIEYKEDINGYRSMAGLAATAVTASGYNFWLQTYGPCNMSQQSNRPGKTQWYRMGYPRYNGNMDVGTQVGTNTLDQIVGFTLDNNDDVNGTTNFMLTISS